VDTTLLVGNLVVMMVVMKVVMKGLKVVKMAD
jgi:hypothetical protein